MNNSARLVSRLAALTVLLAVPPDPSCAQGNDTPVIRATTRLVQLNVVVLDKHNRPVTRLSQDDFRVFDNGREQKVAHFSASAGALVRPRSSPLVINNRPVQAGERTIGTTVVLVDENIGGVPFASAAAMQPIRSARLAVLKFLATLQSGEQVALYALRRERVVVIHDFTDDTEALIAAAKAYGSGLLKASTPFGDSKDVVGIGVANPHPSGGDVAAVRDLRAWLAPPSQKYGRAEDLSRVLSGDALHAIAYHLRGIPGRKNLVWISSDFPSEVTDFNPSLVFDERMTGVPVPGSHDPLPIPHYSLPVNHHDRLRGFARELSDANVSVYPIDAKALMSPLALVGEDETGNEVLATERGEWAAGNLVGQRSAMDLIASETGGRAFYDTNALDQHLHEIVEEGSAAYQLGYYPGDAAWDGKYHRIELKVKRDGITALCRKGYFATDGPVPQNTEMVLRLAAKSVLEGAGIGLTLNVDSNPLEWGQQKVVLRVDTRNIYFEQNGERWMASLDLAFAELDKDGRLLGGIKDRVDLALYPDTYSEVTTLGWFYPRELFVDPAAERLRIVVRDLTTGTVGSVSVPVLHYHSQRN